MEKTVKKTISSFGVLFILVLSFFICPFELLATDSTAQKGLDTAASKAYGKDVSKGDTSGVITSLPDAIGRIIGSILQFIGAFFLILTIYGGFTWMFARGNDQEVAKAREIIQAALIGLIIVLAAYAITSFVGNQLIDT